MTTQELEMFIKVWIGSKGIEILNELNAWEEFGDFDQFILEAHAFGMKQASSPAIDIKEMKEFLDKYNQEISALAKQVKLQGEEEQTFFTQFGDMKTAHLALMPYALAKLSLIFMAQKKLINQLLRERNSGQFIAVTQKISKT